jgi:aconitase A
MRAYAIVTAVIAPTSVVEMRCPLAGRRRLFQSEDLNKRFRTTDGVEIGSGDVMIAAIISCTNASNRAC